MEVPVTHVPNLRFEGEISPEVIDRVMVLQKSKTMDTFSLSDMPHCNEYQLLSWIVTAIERNVRILHLLGFKVLFPMCLFTSETLVDLRLEKCVGYLSVGSHVCLPSLKRLYLHGFMYPSEEDLPCWLSGCPVLEELCIMKVTMGSDFHCFNISSPSMKKLEIDSLTFTHHNFSLMINAPTLWYLKVNTVSNRLRLSLSPMTSLIQADMRLYRCNFTTRKLFDWFPNVKCLKLSGFRCKFSQVADSAVKFDYLTKLELGFSVDWDELVKFLKIADKLQVLVTHQVSNNWGYWIEPRKGCLLHSLETLTIRDFGCTEKELCMLKYVLRNAIALKRVIILSRLSDVDLKAKYDIVKRILQFRRGSECEVDFD